MSRPTARPPVEARRPLRLRSLPPYVPRIDAAQNGPYVGPEIPGIAVVTQTMNDYLFDIAKGGYFGHPNPKRHEYVLNGGNPTSNGDPAQVNEYPQGVMPDRNWRGFAFDFGQHYSPDGITEYKSGAFGGALTGKLLVVRYSGGDDILVLTPGADGRIIKSQSGIVGLTGFIDRSIRSISRGSHDREPVSC